ncbi:MAG: ABC transporter permease [Acidobacteria bacterium]|nr:ABC transporter permease [Acidobacteriota bacterium]
MNTLNRKLLRDFWRLRGQVTAVVLVVACGVAAFVAMRGNHHSLLASQNATYEEFRFADVFVNVKRAPVSVIGKIAAIDGVAAAETRIVRDVTLDIAGLDEPATGRLVSIPETRRDFLNGVFIRKGRYIEAGRRDEVLASEAFVEANKLDVGDDLSAIINGRFQKLRIVGVALSPEYVYGIRAGEIFPDSRRFGVLWMNRETLEHIFDMDGAFNDLTLRLTGAANEAEVIARVDSILDEYGGQGAFGRASQPSHEYLTNEIAELNTTGIFIPTIFLGVTAFLLNLVMTRFVAIEREKIAVLKAFGYGNSAIGWHYLKFAFLTILIGSALGIAVGSYIGAGITALYAEFFRFPISGFEVTTDILMLALAVSFGAGLLGALSAVRRAVRLAPAEAMRPEPPARFQAGFLERLGLLRFMSPAVRIIFRNLTRNPLKAVLTSFGISLSVMMLVVSFYMYFDALTDIIFVQFRLVQREDVSVYFNEPQPPTARYDLAALDGVLRVEPFRIVPVRLRNGHFSRRLAIIGLEPSGELRQMIDRERSRVAVPPDGVVLTTKLAEILHVAPDDQLTLEILEGKRPVKAVRVAGLIDELIGLSVYMDKSALNRLLGEDDSMSGAYLAVDQSKAPPLYRRLKNTPSVSAVGIPEAALSNFNATISRTMYTSISFIIGFASVISMGIVYNGARIALSERSRELASLRVLGFTRREIGTMLLGEQAFLTAAAIPLGWLLGYGLCVLMVKAVDAELIRLPLIVSPKSYVYALLATVTASTLSALLVGWRLRRLDLIEALKTRE